MSIEKAVSDVTKGYEDNTTFVRQQHAGLIATLVAEIEAKGGFDAIRDHFESVTGEAVGSLGADAANQLEDYDDQESAITSVEDWISENVSNAGTEANVVCAVWGYGPEQAAADIRAELARVSAPRV